LPPAASTITAACDRVLPMETRNPGLNVSWSLFKRRLLFATGQTEMRK